MSYCQVCGGVCVASVPSGQRASVESELAELQRYRDREPLVQQLVNAVMDEPLQLDADEPACAIVRFGDPATPAASVAAGDESA